MKSIGLFVAAFLVLPLAALELDTNKIKILQCMAAFEFDFVAEELGFSISGVDDKGQEVDRDPQIVERLRIEQTNRFLEIGKLTPLAGGDKKERKLSKKEVLEQKNLARRCHIIAETVVEVMALKGHLQETPAKTPARGLEQSL